MTGQDLATRSTVGAAVNRHTLPHSRYKIIDPEGNKDWLCAYDIRVIEP